MKYRDELPDSSTQAATRLGFWTSLSIMILTLITFALAISATPITGPWCQADCVQYPFADVVAKVPHDYLWLYPAVLLELGVVILFASLHHSAAARHKVYSQIALLFAGMSALLVSADYYMQFAALQPSIVRGEQEGVALFSQYNTHGVFIVLEELGYFLMGLALLFAAPVFAQPTRLARVLRWLFVAAAILTLGGWFAFYGFYGFNLEYRFEVYTISVNWLTLIIAGIPLSRWFLGRGRSSAL